ncbi:hypothetical protein F25303_7628 [Fusarium sp. NRRL 25303]|nr:hypothetical protein F25303_7628 [Fusarium sp. NRRL 25303]
MAPPCLSRLLLIFLVGLTHVIAHPVNKDDSAVLGSVNVKGSRDLKWKPKGEKHDHRQTHVQHGNEKSTTVVYQKITVTSDGKDLSKDKPGKNGHEESTKTEHQAEFSSKHDRNVGATHKDEDLEIQEHKKHRDENIKYKNKPEVQPDLFKPYRSSRTSANDNKKSETTKQWKDNSIDKIKNSQSYKKFGEKQQTQPTDPKYVKPQRENRVKEPARPMVGEDRMIRVKKPYDNVFAEGRRREKQEELKNKLSKNDKREADKDGKPLSPDDDSAIQPEFNVSDVTKEQWEKLTEDKESMKMLEKAKKEYKKLFKTDKEEAENEFKEILRQALAQSDKKAQEREKLSKYTNKTSKPNKYAKYIEALMEEKPGKPYKAELAPIGEKGVEKKETIGKRCLPWWVYLIVELKKKEKMKKEKKKMEEKMEEKLRQLITPPSTKFTPDSDNKTRPGLNDKKQDSKAKLQTENKESKKKPETKTNTASERPMPTRSSLFDNAVAIEINNFTAKEPVSSHFDSLKSKLTISKLGHKEKNQDKLYIAPGKTENLDKAKLSIETEETNEKTKESVKTYKTPHQEKYKEINKEPKLESQQDSKSSKDKHSDQGEKSLTARRPIGPPRPDHVTLFNYLRRIRRQRARERYLQMLMEKHPELKAKLREKYPNHPMLKDKNPRRKGSIIPT